RADRNNPLVAPVRAPARGGKTPLPRLEGFPALVAAVRRHHPGDLRVLPLVPLPASGADVSVVDSATAVGATPASPGRGRPRPYRSRHPPSGNISPSNLSPTFRFSGSVTTCFFPSYFVPSGISNTANASPIRSDLFGPA